MPATIRAKETSRARGERKSTLHRLVLVSTRLLVPDHTKLLRIQQITALRYSANGVYFHGISAIKRDCTRRSHHDCNSPTQSAPGNGIESEYR